MSNYGTRNTFQIFGTAAGFCGLTYFILHRFYLVKIERLRLRRKSGNHAHIFQGFQLFFFFGLISFVCFFFFTMNCVERIAEVIASGVEPEDEPEEEEFIIPPDNLLGRRKSCF